MRITPPMVTMLSAEAEIQYVALSNIRSIMSEFPNIFHESYKVITCLCNMMIIKFLLEGIFL